MPPRNILAYRGCLCLFGLGSERHTLAQKNEIGSERRGTDECGRDRCPDVQAGPKRSRKVRSSLENADRPRTAATKKMIGLEKAMMS